MSRRTRPRTPAELADATTRTRVALELEPTSGAQLGLLGVRASVRSELGPATTGRQAGLWEGRDTGLRAEGRYVRVDPATGLHVGPATTAEVEAYRAQRCPIRVGAYLIDEYTGPGLWFGGAGF